MAVNQLLGAMLPAHALDWASAQLDNCRTYMLSPTGRFQQWCATVGNIIAHPQLPSSYLLDGAVGTAPKKNPGACLITG